MTNDLSGRKRDVVGDAPEVEEQAEQQPRVPAVPLNGIRVPDGAHG